jgi:hypothetical protein
MLRSRKREQNVHLEPKIDVAARRGVADLIVQRTFIVDGHLAEEIDVGAQVTLAHPVLAQFDQQSVLSILVPAVSVLLITRLTELLLRQFSACEPADRVVPSASVIGDRAQHATHIRIERAVSREKSSVLSFQGVRHVVALQSIVIVEEHC